MKTFFMMNPIALSMGCRYIYVPFYKLMIQIIGKVYLTIYFNSKKIYI